MRIQQLPQIIANQIAAGEVIERPASVVKELLENAFDAGATVITLEIGYGGLNQIKISDNGLGIVAEDLPLAIAAHATSKINVLNDLYAINSMGFRGEALASIASIAKVTISSKPAGQDTAMMLHTQENETTLSVCARTQGTTIDVIDLFFNAPVRKRFLKSEKLEFQAIEAVVKRFALSAPHITLTLKHNGKQVLSVPAALSQQAQLTRLSRIFGSTFVKEAIYLDVERGAMRLYGWISGVHFQRSQNDRQWVYINQRVVKDKLINHAIKQAYDEVLHPGRFPACVLYLTINHDEVDVNVHPTKHEVRFQQPRLVHDFFTSQLTSALSLQQHNKEKTAPLADHINVINEIHEPYPQLIDFHQLESPVEKNTGWITLNSSYILTWIGQQPHIVDVTVLQRAFLQEHLTTLSLPLQNRPLLIPFYYSLPTKTHHWITELIQSLTQIGIILELSSEEGKVLIHTLPVHIPHLDLRVFLDAVVKLNNFPLSELFELITLAQAFDPNVLSVEEKMELNHFLMSIQDKGDKKTGLLKPLLIEDCRNLLHV